MCESKRKTLEDVVRENRYWENIPNSALNSAPISEVRLCTSNSPYTAHPDTWLKEGHVILGTKSEFEEIANDLLIPTVEDAVRELGGDWTNAGGVTHSESFNLLWRNEEGVWYTAHPNSLAAEAGKTVCTRAEFEKVAKRMFTPAEADAPYAPKPGEWFEVQKGGSEAGYWQGYCVGFDPLGKLVYYSAVFEENRTIDLAEGFDFRPRTPPSKKEEWVETVRPLIASAKGNKEVVERVYEALVSGKLPAPEPEDTQSP